MARQTGLGKGFGSLIPKDLDRTILQDDSERVHKIGIQDVFPNPEQPRKQFDQAAHNEMVASVKQHGILQPLIVVRSNEGYRIVAGERRWRAAKDAGLENIPAIVRSLQELEEVEMALIENIQRVDLSPWEQALSVFKLQQQFNMTLDEIAKKLGKATSTISNLTRLLQLPDAARQALQDGKISEGHARAILALKGNESKQAELLSCILNNKWSVRQAEQFVLDVRRGKKPNASPTYEGQSQALTKQISDKLAAKVTIKRNQRGGQIIIHFKNDEQLRKIIDIF